MIQDKEQETSVIKKANDFIFFNCGDVHFLDIMKFRMEQLLWIFLSEHIKLAKRKYSSPLSGLTTQTNLIFPIGRPMMSFSIKLKQQSARQRLFWLLEAEKE